MLNVLNREIEKIEAREEFYAPTLCPACWNEPVVAGGLGAECLSSLKEEVEC